MSSSPLLSWLAAAAGLGVAAIAWRLRMARRRSAAARAARERADLAALATARRMADEATARAQQRAADRVIAAELRRQAALRKAENAASAASAGAASVASADAAHRLEAERHAQAERLAAAERRTRAERRVVRAAAFAAAATAQQVVKTAAQTLIMLVDDSKMVRVKTGRLLAAHEFQVVTAVDGLDALAQLEQCRPDLLITDVDMPRLDGFALVARLRGQAATAQLPIVMITSGEDRLREEARRAGVGQIFGKPYVDEELIAHLKSYRFVMAAPLVDACAHA